MLRPFEERQPGAVLDLLAPDCWRLAVSVVSTGHFVLRAEMGAVPGEAGCFVVRMRVLLVEVRLAP